MINSFKGIHKEFSGFSFCQWGLHLRCQVVLSLSVFFEALSTSFFKLRRIIRSGVSSTTCLYYARKALAKSFQEWMWSRLNCMYHLATDPIKLSWKQWMRSLSLSVCPVMLRQYIVKWVTRHVLPLYFTNSGILNLGGKTKSETKVSSVAPILFFMLSPSISLNLSFIVHLLSFCTFSVDHKLFPRFFLFLGF